MKDRQNLPLVVLLFICIIKTLNGKQKSGKMSNVRRFSKKTVLPVTSPL